MCLSHAGWAPCGQSRTLPVDTNEIRSIMAYMTATSFHIKPYHHPAIDWMAITEASDSADSHRDRQHTPQVTSSKSSRHTFNEGTSPTVGRPNHTRHNTRLDLRDTHHVKGQGKREVQEEREASSLHAKHAGRVRGHDVHLPRGNVGIHA